MTRPASDVEKQPHVVLMNQVATPEPWRNVSVSRIHNTRLVRVPLPQRSQVSEARTCLDSARLDELPPEVLLPEPRFGLVSSRNVRHLVPHDSGQGVVPDSPTVHSELKRDRLFLQANRPRSHGHKTLHVLKSLLERPTRPVNVYHHNRFRAFGQQCEHAADDFIALAAGSPRESPISGDRHCWTEDAGDRHDDHPR
jgi:hypothetical protein